MNNELAIKKTKKIIKDIPVWRRREAMAGYLFALPWIIGFFGFTFYPMLLALYYSFTNFDILRPPVFVGLANYQNLFADRLFIRSMQNTLYFVFVSVPLGMLIGLGIALLLNRDIKGIAALRTAYYMPSIVPLVANTILWLWMFAPRSGILTSLVRFFGMRPPGWLSDPAVALNSLILMSLWSAGSGMIIYLAGLKNIPSVYYEAARIDGAGGIRQFFTITLPLLTPTIFFQLIIGLIGSFQIFTQALIMTEGGPNDSTLTYVLYLYFNAFRFWRMGYASAMAWILFIMMFSITFINFILSKYWVNYDQS